MTNQSKLPLCYAPEANTAILSNDLGKTKDDIPKMRNCLVYCPKCHYFVGAWDKRNYYQCCHRKSHKIKKEGGK